MDNRTGFRRRGHGYLADQARKRARASPARCGCSPRSRSRWCTRPSGSRSPRPRCCSGPRRSGSAGARAATPGLALLTGLLLVAYDFLIYPSGSRPGPVGAALPMAAVLSFGTLLGDRRPPAADPDRRRCDRRGRHRRCPAPRGASCARQGRLVHPAGPRRLGNRRPGPGAARGRIADARRSDLRLACGLRRRRPRQPRRPAHRAPLRSPGRSSPRSSWERWSPAARLRSWAPTPRTRGCVPRSCSCSGTARAVWPERSAARPAKPRAHRRVRGLRGRGGRRADLDQRSPTSERGAVRRGGGSGPACATRAAASRRRRGGAPPARATARPGPRDRGP